MFCNIRLSTRTDEVMNIGGFFSFPFSCYKNANIEKSKFDLDSAQI